MVNNMSENFPVCPLSNHNTCKKFYDPKVCAIARKEDVCLWKHPESKKEHTDFKDVVDQTNNKEPASEDIVDRKDRFIAPRLNEKPEENKRSSKFWIFGQNKKSVDGE
jgi:hypothetical protein